VVGNAVQILEAEAEKGVLDDVAAIPNLP